MAVSRTSMNHVHAWIGVRLLFQSRCHAMADIKDIFAQAIEVPPAQRAAFLDEACAGDPQLRANVDELIAAHEGAGIFFAGPTIDSPNRADPPPPAPVQPPRRIGP